MPVSAVRAVTERHGKAMHEQQELDGEWPQCDGVEQVIAQTDGSMVPVVVSDSEASDKRKGKSLSWKEIRLVIAYEHKRVQVHYGGNFSGGVEETGRQLYGCARRAGCGGGLAVAAETKTEGQSGVAEVVEVPSVAEEDAPVRRAHRYLRNRLDQVDYKGAAERELPIGSGEIESSHRYVVQARLKRTGAWWSGDNIDSMLSLRLCRANDQ